MRGGWPANFVVWQLQVCGSGLNEATPGQEQHEPIDPAGGRERGLKGHGGTFCRYLKL